MIYAMARDERFPAHQLLRRVNARTQTPVAATILPVVLGFAVLLVLPGDALLALITSGTIFPAVTYGCVVILYLAVRKHLDRNAEAFDLGRYETPVAVAALIWTICAVVILISPDSTTVPLVIVAGLLVVGALYFGYMMVFNRGVLDHEPGNANVFTH
jgi:amino acid transporter